MSLGLIERTFTNASHTPYIGYNVIVNVGNSSVPARLYGDTTGTLLTDTGIIQTTSIGKVSFYCEDIYTYKLSLQHPLTKQILYFEDSVEPIVGDVVVTNPTNGSGGGSGGGTGLLTTYTAAQLDALAQSGTTPSPAPSAPFPQIHAASDDPTRTFLVSSATVAMETTVLPLTKDVADVLAFSISNSTPTLIASVDAKDFARMAFWLQNLDSDPLTDVRIVCRNSPGDPWTVTHGVGYGSYTNGTGTSLSLVDDGFLISVVAPRDPKVLAQNETAFIKLSCEGARYWGIQAQVAGAANGNVNLTGFKLMRGN